MIQPEVGTRIGLPDWIAGLYWIGLNLVNPNSDWDWIGLNSRGITDRIGLNFPRIAERIGLNLDRFFLIQFNPYSIVMFKIDDFSIDSFQWSHDSFSVSPVITRYTVVEYD